MSRLSITAIAAFLSNFAEFPVVQHALAGVNAAVVALIASSVLKLSKSTLKDTVCIGIFLVAVVLAFFVGLSPVLLIVAAGLVGYVVRMLWKLELGGSAK